MPLNCWTGKPIWNLVASCPILLSEAATGVTEICGVMLSDQLSSVPVTDARSW